MLRSMMVVLGCLGLMSTANAESEAARGLQTSLADANTTQELFASTVLNQDGEEGYISIVLSEGLLSIPAMRTPQGPMLGVSEACVFAPSTAYSNETRYVRVVDSNAELSGEDSVLISVTMLVGDASAQDVISCQYTISAEDADAYGQGVFSIEFMQDQGHLPESLFDFGVDPYQLMLDTSVPA